MTLPETVTAESAVKAIRVTVGTLAEGPTATVMIRPGQPNRFGLGHSVFEPETVRVEWRQS
jgi:hypothetical protein